VARDEHIAQPVGDAALLELSSKAQRTNLPQPGQSSILLWVEVLQQTQHRGSHGSHLKKLLHVTT